MDNGTEEERGDILVGLGAKDIVEKDGMDVLVCIKSSVTVRNVEEQVFPSKILFVIAANDSEENCGLGKREAAEWKREEGDGEEGGEGERVREGEEGEGEGEGKIKSGLFCEWKAEESLITVKEEDEESEKGEEVEEEEIEEANEVDEEREWVDEKCKEEENL